MTKIIVCILLLTILLAPSALSHTKSNIPESLPSIFMRVSLATGVDYKLLKAIAIVESNLDPWAIGDYGKSLGLMQIHKTTRKHYRIPHHSLLFNPEVNIRVGAMHLKYLINKYGVEKAIYKYNAGESGYRKGIRSTVYYHKVMKELRHLRLSSYKTERVK